MLVRLVAIFGVACAVAGCSVDASTSEDVDESQGEALRASQVTCSVNPNPVTDLSAARLQASGVPTDNLVGINFARENGSYWSFAWYIGLNTSTSNVSLELPSSLTSGHYRVDFDYRPKSRAVHLGTCYFDIN